MKRLLLFAMYSHSSFVPATEEEENRSHIVLMLITTIQLPLIPIANPTYR